MRWQILAFMAATLLLPQALAQETSTGSLYRVGPGDKIQIRVDELPDLSDVGFELALHDVTQVEPCRAEVDGQVVASAEILCAER